MNDDQLRRELERRAKRAAVPDLQSGISSRLKDDRRQPARVARWAPLAGLAAAAVIVVALIIAWPRTMPVGPASESSPAAETVIHCTGMDHTASQATIADQTGLVQGCATIPTDQLSGPITNPQGVTTILDLLLSGSPCAFDAPLTFSRDPNGFYLRSAFTGGVCVSSESNLGIRLSLNSAIDRSKVSVLLDEAAATALPIASWSCGGNITVSDHSGLVKSCADAGVVDRHSQDPTVSNPNGDPSTVHIWWGRSQDILATSIDVYRSSDGSYFVSVVDQAAPDSQFFPDAHSVDLTFDEAIPASTVTLRSYSGPSGASPSLYDRTPSIEPTPSPPGLAAPTSIDCDTSVVPGNLPVVLTDHAGLIVSCSLPLTQGTIDTQPVLSETGTDVGLTFDGQWWCNVHDFALDMWNPRTPNAKPYALQINRNYQDQLDYPTCLPDRSNIEFDLSLDRGISATDVDWFVTSMRGGEPMPSEDDASAGASDFQVQLTTDKAVYPSNDAIQPVAYLSYNGPKDTIDLGVDRAFGLMGPWFVEQLDGDLWIGNGGSLLLPYCQTLTNGDTKTFHYQKPSMPVDGPPQDPRLQALYNGPDLILPAGTWRIYTMSSFNAGGCGADGVPDQPVRLGASVVIQVR